MAADNFKDIMRTHPPKDTPNLILEILAVQVFGFRQTDLIDCLNRLGCRDEQNKLFSYKNIHPFLSALEKNNAISHTENGITCTAGLWMETIGHLVMQDRFKIIAEQVLTSVPLFKPAREKFYAFNTRKEFYRAILIAVFTDEQFADLDLVCRSGMKSKKISSDKAAPFLTLFNHPFLPDLMDKIKLPVRWKVLGYILDDAQKKSIPVPEVLAYGTSLLSEFPGSDRDFRVLDHCYLAGRLDLHKKFLSGYKNKNTCNFLVQQGKSALLCEDTGAALGYFKQALAARNEKNPPSPYSLNGDTLFFFLLALLESEETEDLYLGIRCIIHSQDNPEDNNPSLTILSKAMLPLFYAQVGKNFDPEIFPEHLISMENPAVAFFSILILSWRGEASGRPCISVLKKNLETSMNCGYDWLTAEIHALLARLGSEASVNTAKANALHDVLGTNTLVNRFSPVSEWKKALLSLIRMGEGHAGISPGTPPPEQRLIWQLTYNDKIPMCHLTPRIQKINKNGTWSRGKPIPPATLQHTYPEMDFLTPQDQSVCAAIEKTRFHGMYRNYHETGFLFNMEKALPALVGHPFIFLETDLHTPVELVEGTPELRLRSVDSKLHIHMEPMPIDQMNRVTILRETANRFKVVTFSTEHINIFRLVGEQGLVIPRKETKQVSQAIAAVSSFITVNSDIKTQDVQTFVPMAADSTPHVHLTPWQAGIKMQILVRPFGQSEPYFRPGNGGRHVLADIAGKKTRVARDMEQEKNNEQQIVLACPTIEHRDTVAGEWVVEDPEQALELLLELKSCQEKMVLKWPRGQKIKRLYRVSLSDFALTLKKDRDWFKATGNLLAGDDISVDLSRLMSLLESTTGRFIPLDDGTFLAITQELRARLQELNAYSTPHGDGRRFSPLAAPAMKELMDQAGSLESDLAWKSHCRKLKETIQPEIPNTLRGTLRDYQITGFNWLCRLAHWNVGACLADDMGLGKTVQSLAAILVHASKGPTLVVAPLSVMNNWKEECKNFAPALNPLIFGGKDRQLMLDSLAPCDLVICSYGLLTIEAKKLSKVGWQTIVLDEAQAIKNRKTKRSKAAMKLTADFRLITTGTPVENRLEELWTLFHFLNPGLLGTYHRFKQMFIVPIEGNQDKEASQRLKKLIRPFLLRRLKNEVLRELPEKTEINLQVEMSRDEAILYEAQRRNSLEKIDNADDSPGQKRLRILTELTRLRQLCCNPSLVLADTNIKSSKLKVFMDTVKELLENQHKALVFSQFVGHLAILRKALDKEKITYQYLDGSTSAKNRKERIDAFQNGTGDLFLISLKAGGTGLNLTAADYVIHMDPWWNPAVEDQASDRAHRIGQTRPVTVYRLVVKDSIEERIVNLHKEKRDLAESLLAGSEAAGKLSASALLELLQGETANH
ncbi:MAG TPA: DEAD/DEAH box helicase [Desulfotignum sp.]|nr:DEAD/DEAH box helicase [Desulfotignum sp.]